MSSASRAYGQADVAAALSRGVWGAFCAVLVEFAFVVVLRHAQLTSLWELQNGFAGLAPAWLLLAAPAGVWGAALGVCWQRRDSRAARIVSALLLGVSAGVVGWGVGGGRHLATAELRAGFALVFGCAVGLVGFALFALLGRALTPKNARQTAALAFGFLASALVLSVLNRVLLVRLYPAFHAGLGFGEVALFGLAFSLLLPRVGNRWTTTATATLLALLVIALAPASRASRGFDNFRWLVTEGSPTLGWGVELAGLVAPPDPISLDAAAQPLGARKQGQGLDFRGRSILLVTIDALRADHVGAYGGKRGTTPNIDALAAHGVTFEAAYAATPHTSYSLSSLMTGKYMRPLLLQGAGADSDLWPELLRTYGYRTAAFYPPAVFFIDSQRFAQFRDKQLGFEYAKVEFAEGELRVGQVAGYLANSGADKPLFLWVHLFGPHEPYEPQSRDFGPRDVDRYDSEVFAADETVGRLLDLFAKRDPRGIVMVTADHGEEFGDHGGRYHGTSVYDEQVRVPLVVSGPGLSPGRRVAEPVQTIDLFPTILAGLSVPQPPRIRGRDLGPLLAGPEAPPGAAGRALAETDDYTLLAEGELRLICARRSGACQLFDTSRDPGQKDDLSLKKPDVFQRMRAESRALSASHGVYETAGLRSEGKGWPAAILRGLSGDAEVAPELALLLDDADVSIRRKSAELLFTLSASGQSSALRLAASREEDPDTRRFIALALTRAGQGAPLVREMLQGSSLQFRRLAALALAEQGDRSGEDELIAWWSAADGVEFDQALQLLEALGSIKSEKALDALVARLGDVRLRPHIARVLAEIGDEDARPALARALLEERYVSARMPLGRALLSLGARQELAAPLIRFLGVPDALDGGLQLGLDAGVLEMIGGPSQVGLSRLAQLGDSGVQVEVTVPYAAKNTGVRLVALVQSKGTEPATLLVARGQGRRTESKKERGIRQLPQITGDGALRLQVPARGEPVQVTADVPASWGARPGQRVTLDVFVDQAARVLGLALVPLSEELPPPPPEPWEKQGPAEP